MKVSKYVKYVKYLVLIGFLIALCIDSPINPVYKSIAAVTGEKVHKLPDQTVYMNAKNAKSATTSFYIEDAISISNFSSTNTKIKIAKYVEDKDNDVWKITGGTRQLIEAESKGITAYVNAKSTGNSTINFKASYDAPYPYIRYTLYKKKIIVKKYVNPIKELTITNVSGGKNIAKNFDTKASGKDLKVAKSADMKVNAKAAKDWVITEVNVINKYKSDINSANRSYGSGASNVKTTLYDYNNKGTGQLVIKLQNKKDKGVIEITMNLKKGTTKK